MHLLIIDKDKCNSITDCPLPPTMTSICNSIFNQINTDGRLYVASALPEEMDRCRQLKDCCGKSAINFDQIK